MHLSINLPICLLTYQGAFKPILCVCVCVCMCVSK